MKRDGLVRAMTDDGGFRVIACSTTFTVTEAARRQKVEGTLAARFGELLTGAVLVRETMAPRLRVQAILRGAGGHGTMVADSHPEGETRGLVQRKAEAGIDTGPGALLQVMRTMPTGSLHTGTVAIPATGSISDALMGYMQASEQVESAIAVGCLLKDGAIVAAGGYVIQILPELSESMLAIMTERLTEFPSMETLLAGDHHAPDDLLAELLYGMPFTRLEDRAVSFGCQCSQTRLVASLSTLSADDLASLVENDDPLQITCDYCGKEYEIPPEQLRGMLEKN